MRSREVWRPIAPWSTNWSKSHLAEAYREFNEGLTEEDRAVLMERSLREWSIETGEIEGAFHLERGITVQLIEQGFLASLLGHQRNGLSGEQVQAILNDTKQAVEGLFAFVKSNEPLTATYIRQLHQQLMSSVSTYDAYYIDPVTNRPRLVKKSLEPGKYKEEPNNPWRDDGSVEVYCPPHAVAEQMDSLVNLYNQSTSEVPVEQKAAWLHHAFTQIHPFQDGNGRVARALASLALIKGGLPPLTVYRDMKARYIRSLEMADSGANVPLIAFFESCIYRQVVAAWQQLSIDGDTRGSVDSSTVSDIIAAAQARLMAKYQQSRPGWSSANENMTKLAKEEGHRQLQEIQTALAPRLGAVNPTFTVSLGETDYRSDSSHSIARLENWGMDATEGGELRAWALTIRTASSATIYVLLDHFSAIRRGICAAAVILKRGESVWSPEPRFFHNFKEPPPTERFRAWLSESLRQALAQWQSGLEG